MFLRASTRKKDGKEHRYFSVVENRRVSGGRVLQRHVLYLGEINSSQELAWRRSIEVLDEATRAPRTLALFPEDRCEGVVPDESIVRLRLAQLRLEQPRQWGACWLALKLWQSLGLDEFWSERLTASRKGTRFDQVLLVLVVYRLLSPGSEWRLHRHWFERSALGDLLGADAALADIHTLYACHDRLLEHKEAVFDHLVSRWRDLFNATFDVLLYDLTSTYFESDPPLDDEDKRRHGYSRDHRPDCVQVVIALVVTPEGFPLAYEVLAGNTADSTTLKDFLARIERQYGKARRWWDACLSGSEGVGLAWATLLGFIRITTNRKVVARPLPIRDVMARIHGWLELPHVHVAQPSETHFARLRAELERLGTAGNLTTDAHLAALAMERGYILYSTDADFGRFPALRWVNPCGK